MGTAEKQIDSPEPVEKKKRPLPAGMTPWQPGQSGNPNGRPRKRPQSEANDDLLRMEIPEAWRKALNRVVVEGNPTTVEILKKGATFADAIAYGLTKKAIAGDPMCARELRESVEGRSTQRFELAESRGFELRVVYEPVMEKILDQEPEELEKKLLKPADADSTD